MFKLPPYRLEEVTAIKLRRQKGRHYFPHRSSLNAFAELRPGRALELVEVSKKTVFKIQTASENLNFFLLR